MLPPSIARRRFLSAAGSAALAIACGSSEPRFDFIRVAAVGPLTGQNAAAGHDVVDGVRLAIEDTNTQADRSLPPIELVVADAADRTRLERLPADSRLLLTVGYPTRDQVAMLRDRQGPDAPATIALANDERGTAPPGFVELAPSVRQVAETTAAAVAYHFGPIPVSVVVSGTVEAVEHARAFLEVAPERRLIVRSTLYLRSIETGYSQLVASVRAGAPQVLVAIGHGHDAGGLWSALRPRDARVRLVLGAGTLGEGFQRTAGGFFEGVLGLATTPLPREVESATSFVETFGARYGRAPSPLSARAYDATLLGLSAIRRAGGGRRPARSAVRATLAATDRFTGPFRSYRLAGGTPSIWPLAFYRLERDGTPTLIGQPSIT